MTIKWLGHACFLLKTSNGTRIITDPYDPSVGYGTLDERADIVTMSHSHHDHNYIAGVSGYGCAVSSEGSFAFKDVTIETLNSFHDDARGAKRGLNLITRITGDGLSVVHLGDLGHEPDAKQLEFIKNVDVLLIPVGGFYTIDTAQALKIVSAAKPRSVIPMHYSNARCAFPISTVDEFARALNAKYSESDEVEIASLRGAVVLPLPKR